MAVVFWAIGRRNIAKGLVGENDLLAIDPEALAEAAGAAAAAGRRRSPRTPEHDGRPERERSRERAAEGGPQRQPLAPLRSDFAVRFHDEAGLEPLHDATLRLLETTGMRFESPKALAILKKAGAKVDEGSDLVRLPRRLVEEALAPAPRRFTLGARDASCDLQLGSGFTYGTTDGCGVEVVDWHTGERRSSTKADLEAVTRMQDCLGSISYWWPTVSAGDCGETAQLHEIEAGWNNTSKHLMGMVQGETLARAAVEMATAVAGGAEELRRRPVMSDLIGTVSPLIHDRDGIEAGLVFAEAGVPVCYVTMPNLGTTAPATKAGAFVVGAAEIVAAAVLHELAAPGAPSSGSIMQIYADPRTALTLTTPLDDRCRSSPPSCCTASACRRWARSAAPTPRRRGRGSPASRPCCSSCRCRSTAARSSPASASPTPTHLFTPENLSSTTTSTTARATRSSTSPWTTSARAGRHRRRRARAGTSWPSRTRARTCATPWCAP